MLIAENHFLNYIKNQASQKKDWKVFWEPITAAICRICKNADSCLAEK